MLHCGYITTLIIDNLCWRTKFIFKTLYYSDKQAYCFHTYFYMWWIYCCTFFMLQHGTCSHHTKIHNTNWLDSRETCGIYMQTGANHPCFYHPNEVLPFSPSQQSQSPFMRLTRLIIAWRIWADALLAKSSVDYSNNSSKHISHRVRREFEHSHCF